MTQRILSFGCAVGISCLLLGLPAPTAIHAAIGQSAIITLVFPYGARSTGLGETFTGIADGLEATFYNPAGLGQAPLANSWKSHNPVEEGTLTALAAKRKLDFGGRECVWLGTGSNGLLRYNGRVWETYDTYVIEEGDDLIGVAERFLDVDNEKLKNRAVECLRRANNIETHRMAAIEEILTPQLGDSLTCEKPAFLGEITGHILGLDEFDRTAAKIYGLIATKVDSSLADSLSNELLKVFDIDDDLFSDLVELRIPFDIAVRDSVVCLALDRSGRLWVGTPTGLWRYDGSSWSNYTILDGLPSNEITCLAVSEYDNVAVGTDMGLAILKDGEWKAYGVEDGLPNPAITALAFAGPEVLYVGTESGLARHQDSLWTILDTSDGLLSSRVSALMYDSDQRLWIGAEDGISIFTGTSWKRYRFSGSHVKAFAEYNPGRIWIGSDKGAINCRMGRSHMGRAGERIEEPPIWKAFHSKNALVGDNVGDIVVHGKDIWLITEKALNQYNHGEMQFAVFWEPLLPAFKLPDLWHANVAGIFPTEEWGTIGFFLNYLNFGEIPKIDALGRETGNFQSFEYVFSACYGLSLKEDFSFGINVKYAHSALAPGIGKGSEGIGQTFAVDAGILKRNLFVPRLDLGFTMMNMGPSVFYIEESEADPIPFTLRLGLAYTILSTPVHNLLVALDLDREIVYNPPYSKPYPFWKALIGARENVDGKKEWVSALADESMRTELEEIIVHLGIEYWYAYFLALRTGIMVDEAGSRREVSLGIGLRYGDMKVDWSYIYAPKEWSIARDGQWRFSFTFSP